MKTFKGVVKFISIVIGGASFLLLILPCLRHFSYLKAKRKILHKNQDEIMNNRQTIYTSVVFYG